MLRILHLLDHSLPLHSGYAFRTAAIIREQRRRGWITHQLTGSKQGGNNLSDQTGGLDFFRTRRLTSWWVSLPVGDQIEVIASLEARARVLIAELRPDLVHAHSPCLVGLAALIAARKYRIPIVYEVRALWEEGAVSHGTTRANSVRFRLTRSMETYVVRHVDAVTTICNGLKSNLIERGLSPDRVTIVPNAVDSDVICQDMSEAGRIRDELGGGPYKLIGFLGSFYRYEGLELLIRAVDRLTQLRQDIRLVLAGGGPEEGSLRRAAERSALGERVKFVGRVPHDRIGAYYAAMDLLVYPRLSDPVTEMVTPLKPLEAMANERPVLASSVGGHQELVSHGVNGLLFPPGDAYLLAQAIDDALVNPALQVIARRGREFVMAERTWERSVAQYSGVYRHVLGKRL